jgi:hypothetical protein
VVVVACLPNKNPRISAEDMAVISKQLAVKALETEVRRAELTAKKKALSAVE